MTHSEKTQKQAPWSIVIFITALIIAIVFWQLLDDDTEELTPITVSTSTPTPIPTNTPDTITEVVDDVELVEVAPVIIEPTIEKPRVLPLLNESDSWVANKLQSLTWRKELLKLMVNDDLIRRLVVFADNFSRGYVAYEHNSFVPPTSTFFAKEQAQANGQASMWQWDESSSQRFSLYVELLHSIDIALLVDGYLEMKPLFDEAYQELGYEGDFIHVVEDVINKILDMETPKEQILLTRESVMFKYADAELEALDDADKLLLRLGKDNLLVIKSIMLELSAKLTEKVAD